MEATALLETIDRAVPAALERSGVPGMAVGVLGRGEHATLAFGVASLDTGEPVQPDTAFRVASLTKPIVATLVLRLVEEGRLTLDDPLTGLRLPWEGVTLRHLLSHQTGLAGDWPTRLSAYGDDADAFERLAQDEPLPGPVGPGELFAYCNPGYWLTGALVERATGMPFEDALRQLVLEPLGMERTGFDAAEAATGHRAEPGSAEHHVSDPLPYPRARRPSGGLYSTVGDLLRFAEHHLDGGGPLSPEARREMHTAQVEVNADSAFGLGFGVVMARGRTTLEHGGSLPGYRAQLLLVPDEELALVLLTNSGRGQCAIHQVLEPLGLALRLPAEVALAEDELAAFAGVYREPIGSQIAVSARDGGLDFEVVMADQLTGEPEEHPPLQLRPAGDGRFVVREGDERGDSAEFLRGGRLLRYAWLFERVT
jgi:CubicO group peptidase (beta-lactamase class C family)